MRGNVPQRVERVGQFSTGPAGRTGNGKLPQRDALSFTHTHTHTHARAHTPTGSLFTVSAHTCLSRLLLAGQQRFQQTRGRDCPQAIRQNPLGPHEVRGAAATTWPAEISTAARRGSKKILLQNGREAHCKAGTWGTNTSLKLTGPPTVPCCHLICLCPSWQSPEPWGCIRAEVTTTCRCSLDTYYIWGCAWPPKMPQESWPKPLQQVRKRPRDK